MLPGEKRDSWDMPCVMDDLMLGDTRCGCLKTGDLPTVTMMVFII